MAEILSFTKGLNKMQFNVFWAVDFSCCDSNGVKKKVSFYTDLIYVV